MRRGIFFNGEDGMSCYCCYKEYDEVMDISQEHCYKKIW